MILDIIRLEESNFGNFGTLLIDGRIFCTTLELPWMENVPFYSCVPEGYYVCVRRESWTGKKKHGDTFEVLNVPERSGILFHPANWVYELEGCIAVGQKPGPLRGDRAIQNSGATFQGLMNKIGFRNKIDLRIMSLILDRKKTFFRPSISYDANHGRHTEAR